MNRKTKLPRKDRKELIAKMIDRITTQAKEKARDAVAK